MSENANEGGPRGHPTYSCLRSFDLRVCNRNHLLVPLDLDPMSCIFVPQPRRRRFHVDPLMESLAPCDMAVDWKTTMCAGIKTHADTFPERAKTHLM